MSDTTDAYSHVTVLFADGRSLTGSPVLYGDARALLLKLDEYSRTSDVHTLDAVVQQFCQVTGIAESALTERRTLGEVIEAMQRFFYHRRSGTGPPAVPLVAPGS